MPGGMIGPDLPELEPREVPDDGDLILSGALVERAASDLVRPGRIRVRESELRG
jgi:hypothetical protein